MASILALRTVVGAALVLGALDLLWLNLVLGPRVFAPALVLDRVEHAVPAAPPRPAKELVVADTSMIAPPPEAPAAPPPEPSTAPSPEAPAAPAPSPDRFPPKRVYFSTRSAALRDPARTLLARIARRAGTTHMIVLEGHADHRGSEAFNHMLSKERALAVQAYLETLGVKRSRIRIGFVGEIAAASEGPLWRDRRVEIQIIGGP
ncbi:MAG: OmpA family protein [Myxococcaceae bacterium]